MPPAILLMLITLIACTSNVASDSFLASHLSPYHDYAITEPCHVLSSYFYPYTGFRLLNLYVLGRDLRYSSYPMHVLVYCKYGTHVCAGKGKQKFTSNYNYYTGNHASWNNTIYCVNEHNSIPQCPIQGCFKLAKRYPYVELLDDAWVPDTFVGGLFKCNSANCTNSSIESPVLPLLADELNLDWSSRVMTIWYDDPDNYDDKIVETIAQYRLWKPLVYTPDKFSSYYPLTVDNRWALYIDINEQYEG